MTMRRLASALALAPLAGPAWAQARNPFGVGISEGGGSASGPGGWILAQQGWFEHQLSLAVRALHGSGAAAWPLVGLSFAYGVFHAAGPGHGKAVLTSYMVANERALRRGLALSLAAALLQGLVAVLLVGVLAAGLHATAQRMKDAASLIETASFLAIAVLGAVLVWRKGRVLARRLSAENETSSSLGPTWLRRTRTAAGTVLRPSTRHLRRLFRMRSVGEAGHSILPVRRWTRQPALSFASPGAAAPAFSAAGQRTPAGSARFACVDGDDGGFDPTCAHCQAIDPARLEGPRLALKDAAATVLAAGLRPCSGAILVLVYALSQGLFAAGILSVLAMALGVALTTATLASLAVFLKGAAERLAGSRSQRAATLGAAVEFAAAVLVLVAGLTLLAGASAAGGA